MQFFVCRTPCHTLPPLVHNACIPPDDRLFWFVREISKGDLAKNYMHPEDVLTWDQIIENFAKREGLSEKQNLNPK